jgi:hypothetical protein
MLGLEEVTNVVVSHFPYHQCRTLILKPKKFYEIDSIKGAYSSEAPFSALYISVVTALPSNYIIRTEKTH